jgi:hypothetical protein
MEDPGQGRPAPAGRFHGVIEFRRADLPGADQGGKGLGLGIRAIHG